MRCCVCAAVASLLVGSVALGDEDEVFLFSYFKGNGETGVFLACSEDGLVFRDLNEGRPTPTMARSSEPCDPWS